MFKFFKSIYQVSKTRKFWVGFFAALGNGALVFLADQPEYAPLLSLLASFGVWRVPNK